MDQKWNDGLYREFAKAVCGVVEKEYKNCDTCDFSHIGREVIFLFDEMFPSESNNK